MTISIQPKLTSHQLPDWAAELAGAKGVTLVTVRKPGAVDLKCQSFEQLVADVYQTIRSRLNGLHPVRFWNHIPAIHQPMDERRDRYMVFNAARYEALREWLGVGNNLPAASCVGHDGDDLVVHCLAFEKPGQSIENPRQIPAFRYSAKYGPRPPCFSRATIVTHPVDGQKILLVAGTASIRGETTMHLGDIARQLEETIENLRALLSTSLDAFTDLRVYYVEPQHRQIIESRLATELNPSTRVQMVRAQLCRAELLVEIEGIARIPA